MSTPTARFPLLGEPVPLDLVNTRVATADGDAELLATPEELTEWLSAQAGRLTQPPRRLGKQDLSAVLTLRDHVRTAVDHARQGKRPPGRAVHAVNGASRDAPAYREIAWRDGALSVTSQRAGDYLDLLLAELAEAAADLIADPAITRVRRCEGPGCVLLFLPAHPRRRWCSPTICGNRARVARYYQRHKN